MNTQISNIMSLDDHVIKINLAKNKVKNSLFEMAEAITNALNQLENSQVELAQKLGMSRGTLSKWQVLQDQDMPVFFQDSQVNGGRLKNNL